jgi:hypothetical protein
MQSPYSVTKSSILENKISLKDNEEGNNFEYERILLRPHAFLTSTLLVLMESNPPGIVKMLYSKNFNT